MDISLTTMEQVENKYPTQVINNLEVSDIDENENKVIPVVYSTVKWPFTKEDSPNSTDLEHLPYLDKVPFRFVDSEIGLLVGANMPALIKPIKIVDRGEDEPYASRHKLGWALNGPLNSHVDRKYCHRIKINDLSELDMKIETFFRKTLKIVKRMNWDHLWRI